MDRGAMEELIYQAYAARQKGDIDGLMEAFHPDAVFGLAGDKTALEVVGAVEGHPKVRASMAGFIAAFEFIDRHIISFVIDGERAAVHSRVEVRFIPKNTIFTTEVLDAFKFTDGKIIELVEFADTALIENVMSAV
jgi:ketosteroid isomerase-like protein